jgi:hypothetical protein
MRGEWCDGTIIYQCDGECFGYFEKNEMHEITTKTDKEKLQVCHWCARDGKF